MMCLVVDKGCTAPCLACDCFSCSLGTAGCQLGLFLIVSCRLTRGRQRGAGGWGTWAEARKGMLSI